MKDIKDNIINATEICDYRLMGFFGEFPREHGNCFSVSGEDNNIYDILNFHAENLKEAIKRNLVSFPIQIAPITKRHALIVDGRIPNEWYRNHLCESCTPLEFLPLNQRVNQILEIQRGNRIEGVQEINGEMIRFIKTNIKTQPGLITIPYIFKQSTSAIFEPKEALKSAYLDAKIDSSKYSEINLNSINKTSENENGK